MAVNMSFCSNYMCYPLVIIGTIFSYDVLPFYLRYALLFFISQSSYSKSYMLHSRWYALSCVKPPLLSRYHLACRFLVWSLNHLLDFCCLQARCSSAARSASHLNLQVLQDLTSRCYCGRDRVRVLMLKLR